MRRLLLSAAVCLAVAGVAWAGPVVSTSAGIFANAQNVNGNFTLNNLVRVSNSTTIPHVEIFQNGRPGSGFDFYQFSHAGGAVILDVDDGTSGSFFDTEIGIWTTGGILVNNNDDNGFDAAGEGDDGGSSVLNSRIDIANLLPGDYVVGVAAFNSSFQSGNPYINGAQIPQGGGYQLNISAFGPAAVVPEPVSMAVFGFGIATLGGLGWRRSRKA